MHERAHPHTHTCSRRIRSRSRILYISSSPGSAKGLGSSSTGRAPADALPAPRSPFLWIAKMPAAPPDTSIDRDCKQRIQIKIRIKHKTAAKRDRRRQAHLFRHRNGSTKNLANGCVCARVRGQAFDDEDDDDDNMYAAYERRLNQKVTDEQATGIHARMPVCLHAETERRSPTKDHCNRILVITSIVEGLHTVRVVVLSQGQQRCFVEPALARYCAALAGAHRCGPAHDEVAGGQRHAAMHRVFTLPALPESNTVWHSSAQMQV